MPKVRFEPEGIEIEVPIGTSILEASQKAHGQVGSACGGVCACSTCHVYVKQGLDVLADASDREEDIMDKAFDVRPNSRLGCQSRVDRTAVVEHDYVRGAGAIIPEGASLRADARSGSAVRSGHLHFASCARVRLTSCGGTRWQATAP